MLHSCDSLAAVTCDQAYHFFVAGKTKGRLIAVIAAAAFPAFPSLARTPACLPIDLRHARLPSSSHRFSRRAPLAGRRKDGVVTRALRGFLLVPDVLYSLDPRHHCSRSRAPSSGRVHCPFVFSRFSVVSLPSFSSAFPLLCAFSSSVAARPHLSRTSSHIALTLGHPRRHSYQHQQQFHRTPLPRVLSVYPLAFRARLHRWFPTLSRSWSPGYVTKTKSATLNRSVC